MNIFDHILNRSLAHVVRYNSTPQHFSESVAEHSYYTAYFVSILCELLEKAGENVNKEKAITMALIHDSEEMFSGDILAPFKHFSKEVTDAISKVNREVIPQVFEGLPKDLAEHYVNIWIEEGKQESTEAKIVKAADRLSLVAKCQEEVKVGNQFFQKIYDWQIKKLKENQDSWWLKIKDQILPTG